MLIDALVLAGHRSSILDTVTKAKMKYRSPTLLDRTIVAAADMRRATVIGEVTVQSLPITVL